MNLTKIIRDYQRLIMSICLFMASGLGILLGVVPLARKTMDINTNLNALTAEVKVLKDKVSVLESIDETSMKANVQTLLSAVPSDKSLSTLLGTLDGLSAQTGMASGIFSLAKLGSLATESAKRVTADEQAVGGSIVPFSITMSGSLDQLRGFLAASISVRRLVRIRTLDVSFPKTSSGSASMVSATLGMDAFYTPLPATIGSVSQPLTPPTSDDDAVIAKVTALPLLVGPAIPLPPPAGGPPAKSDPFSL